LSMAFLTTYCLGVLPNDKIEIIPDGKPFDMFQML